MSIPTSFMASTALGLTPCVSMPPEYTFHSSPKIAFPKPSAIWLRQEFPVQIK